MSILLQTLKETGARPGEAQKLEWDDIDFEPTKNQHLALLRKAATHAYYQYRIT